MKSKAPQNDPAVLLYEPRIEGHHLGWLRFITEDLLGAGYKLTLAIDTRPNALARIRGHMGGLLDKVNILSAVQSNSTRIDAKLVAKCLRESGAQSVFLNSFDEIASDVLRNAAWGKMPPRALRGKLGGVYLRPRFLVEEEFSFNNLLKRIGFGRLVRGNWFSHLLFLDPLARENGLKRFPTAPFFFLPDPYPENFVVDAAEARRALQVPEGRRVFLFYGGAYRRKGLHLAVEAFRRLAPQTPALLLCAGQQAEDPDIKSGLDELVRRKQAVVINRYVSEQEEKQLFAASDAVLLPYVNHFGSSGVLSRAAGAGKMIIASDEQLVGRLVRENGLGIVFPSGDIDYLQASIQRSINTGEAQMRKWQSSSQKFGQLCSRGAFHDALLCSFVKH
ncbi:MAG: Transcriptional regulator [Verrucomicrobiales bacterium]|nr:Transcriptional regulator [Verrucomicrobiales bacterium]